MSVTKLDLRTEETSFYPVTVMPPTSEELVRSFFTE